MSVIVDKLAQGYGRTVVIDRLSVTLQSGITALLGPNGAGKTTLLRTLATIMPPRFGTICIDGVEIDSERNVRRVRDNVGYLPQDFGVDPQMTVADFVEYAAWLRGVPARERRQSVTEAVDMVDLTDQRRMKTAEALRWYATAGRDRLGHRRSPPVSASR